MTWTRALPGPTTPSTRSFTVLRDALLDLGALLAAVGVAGRAVVVAAGQSLGVLVDDGDAVGLQVGHGAGDQVADRRHLAAGRVAADRR